MHGLYDLLRGTEWEWPGELAAESYTILSEGQEAAGVNSEMSSKEFDMWMTLLGDYAQYQSRERRAMSDGERRTLRMVLRYLYSGDLESVERLRETCQHDAQEERRLQEAIAHRQEVGHGKKPVTERETSSESETESKVAKTQWLKNPNIRTALN